MHSYPIGSPAQGQIELSTPGSLASFQTRSIIRLLLITVGRMPYHDTRKDRCKGRVCILPDPPRPAGLGKQVSKLSELTATRSISRHSLTSIQQRHHTENERTNDVGEPGGNGRPGRITSGLAIRKAFRQQRLRPAGHPTHAACRQKPLREFRCSCKGPLPQRQWLVAAKNAAVLSILVRLELLD